MIVVYFSISNFNLPKLHCRSASVEQINQAKAWAPHMYFGRDGSQTTSMKRFLFDFNYSRGLHEKNQCEKLAFDELKRSSTIRMLLSALRASGCDFDLRYVRRDFFSRLVLVYTCIF